MSNFAVDLWAKIASEEKRSTSPLSSSSSSASSSSSSSSQCSCSMFMCRIFFVWLFSLCQKVNWTVLEVPRASVLVLFRFFFILLFYLSINVAHLLTIYKMSENESIQFVETWNYRISIRMMTKKSSGSQIIACTHSVYHSHRHTHKYSIPIYTVYSRYAISLDGRINGNRPIPRLGHHLSIVMIRIFCVLKGNPSPGEEQRASEKRKETNWNIKAGEIKWSRMYTKDIGSCDECDEPRQCAYRNRDSMRILIICLVCVLCTHVRVWFCVKWISIWYLFQTISSILYE